jgi:predicted glycosyltransferase
MRALVVVTHLLGAGHLTRAAAVGRALARAGHQVTLVSGGMPAPLVDGEGLSLVQLPPVRIVGTDFRTLLDETGQAVDAARLEARRRLLLATLAETKPDVVVTELFPFGRRVLADEFTALLAAAWSMRPRPLLACSIRDVLAAPGRPEKVDEAHGRLVRSYDLVLVHGDPDLVPLEASWPVDERIRPLLRYTGYVDDGASPPRASRRQGILVSGGSSAASLPLYRAALGAARRIAGESWRILVGNGVPDAEFDALRADAPDHVAVERARRDFRALLTGAALSVSQAGYNTAVDLLRTGTPAVLVPFEAGRETEQRLRAERLRMQGLADIVPEAALSAESLGEAVERGLARGGPGPGRVRLDGAERSAAILEEAVARPATGPDTLDWSVFDEAVRRIRDRGEEPRLWWRDDDAAADTPRLRRLLALSREHDAPVALSAVPELAEPSLAALLDEGHGTLVLVHGFRHVNHAPAGEKSSEFGPHRPLARLSEEAAAGLRVLGDRFGSRLLRVFVPPWNRVASDLVPRLPELGYRGISTFGPRRAPQAGPGLTQFNAHIDPIDWHGTRSLLDPAAVMAQVERSMRLTEPVGLLTHHLVHDEAVWRFVTEFLERATRNNIRMTLAAALLSGENGSSRSDPALC